MSAERSIDIRTEQTGDVAREVITAGAWELSIWHDLDDGEPRIRDIDAAARLGYERPRDVRKLIERIWPENKRPYVRATVARTSMPHGGTRDVKVNEHWLTETELLKLIARSETPIAEMILDDMIATYTAVRRGLLTFRAGSTPAALPARKGRGGRQTVNYLEQRGPRGGMGAAERQKKRRAARRAAGLKAPRPALVPPLPPAPVMAPVYGVPGLVEPTLLSIETAQALEEEVYRQTDAAVHTLADFRTTCLFFVRIVDLQRNRFHADGRARLARVLLDLVAERRRIKRPFASAEEAWSALAHWALAHFNASTAPSNATRSLPPPSDDSGGIDL